MKKKLILGIAIIALLALAAACSSTGAGSSSAATQTAAASSPAGGVGANAPLSSRLAIGTLQLEGTDQAVTKDEAKTLLPLWKAIKSMSSSDTATAEEIQAVYDQIEEAMTADQVTAIKNMEMTQEQMTALMDKLGIDPGQFGGGRMANLTESERATQIAQFQAQRAAGGGFTAPNGQAPSGGSSGSGSSGSSGRRTFTGGQPPSGGMTFSGGSPGMEPGMTGGTGTGTQSTQTAGSTQRRMGGMDRMFLDPLIKILEERAGS